MIPACGPPRSLSPLNSTRSAPAAMLCLRDRFARQAEAGEVEQAPRPHVVDHRDAVLPAEGHEFGERRRFVNPRMR